MTDDRAAGEANRLAERAAALPAGERQAFLDQACGDDSELRRRVAARLESSDEPALLDGTGNADAPTLLENDAEAPTLLRRADGAGGASAPRADPYRLTGTTIAHYEVHERLARGGMGVVYKAFDTRLNREVALKFILLSLSADEKARQRFLVEARTASALDHNNICTIHQIGETASGQVYFAMAFYRGETLAEKIARGRLSVEEALDYGAQIASGLTAAHAKQILHRDMKPANVMVTRPGPAEPRGTVKILDFGLAKMEELHLTRTGSALGTLAYMSPEQARGEPVDQRSDIWAVGVMLFEMLTGQRPFQGSSEVATLQAVLSDEPPPLRRLTPDLAPQLERIVSRCLERDRERRYPSMAELLDELRSAQAQVAGRSAGTLPAATPAPRHRLGGLGAAGGAVLLTVALALAIPATRQLILRPLTGPAAPATRLVAVLPFINSLGEGSENRALADGLTHSIAGLISTLGTVDSSLWVVPATEIVQRDVATAADARKLFGVDRVVTGSVQRPGPTTEITLNLVDPTVHPPRTLGSETVKAPVSPASREAALDTLATLLGVGRESRSRLPEAAARETPPAAYTQYLRGVGYLQRLDQPASLAAAVGAFNEALAEDPTFGAAHAGLCEGLWDRYRLTADPALAEEALASCDRAAELSAGEPEVLVSIGRIYFERGEYRRAEAELGKALELEPGNAEAYRWLGWVRSHQGRSDEAEEALRVALELEPRLWSYYTDLAQILWATGGYEKAAVLCERALELTPENYIVHTVLGVSRENLNQIQEAERLYRRSAELQPNPMAYRNLGLLYFRERQYERAVEALERARDLIPESPSFNDWVVWSWLADAYYWAGERGKAEAAWRRLIEIATPLYEVNPREAVILMYLTEAHVALGDLDKSHHYLNRLIALPVDNVYTLFHLGRIYERLGDRELALGYLTRALEGRFDPVTIDRDPWLRELRQEPGYQVLRQQFLVSATG